MNITTIDQGPISIVTVSGSIAHEEIATIRNRLADLIESKKPRIVLDLRNVPYLNSKLLAVLIDTKNSACRHNGDFKLANANDLIKNLFDITLLAKKIDIYTSVEEAC
jgi:anti-sigma B factor antagonist